MFHRRTLFRGIRPRFAGGPPPDPLAIFTSTNLVGWYDADSAIGGGFNGTPAAVDISGNSNHLRNYTSADVVINSTAFNGHPGFVFSDQSSGVGSGILVAGTGPDSNAFPALGGAGAIFMAVNINTNCDNGGRLFSLGPGGSMPDYDKLTAAELGHFTGAIRIQPAINSVGATEFNPTYGTCYRVAMVWSTPTFWLYVDNVATDGGANAGGTINLGNSTLMSFAFGAAHDQSGASFFHGIMGAMAVVNVLPSSTQRNQMDTYFRNRFGL